MLNSEFRKLYSYLDKLLLKFIESNSTLAYSKLHIIKNHPEFNKEYFPNKDRLIKNEIRESFIVGMLRYIKNFLRERPNFYFKKKNSSKIDVLIVSHLINLKHINLNYDFYYGDIIKQLHSINLNSRLVLRNETSLSSKYVFENLKKDKIILSKRTSILRESVYLFLAIFEFFKFNFFIKKYENKKKKINFFNFRSFGYIIANLRLNFQINFLVKMYNPKFLFITFEGHAWERLIIRNIKRNYKTEIIAYQFSSVTKNHHSLFRSLSKSTDPDYIFTTGRYTYKKFKKNYDCVVKIIGSNKWKSNILDKSKKLKKTVLILPEAYVSESKNLLNFAIKISKLSNDFKFYLRLHPMINFKQLDVNLSNYNNIELSKKTIEDDFKRSSHFIYRGSASAMEAAGKGLQPIYFGTFNNANVNPLFEVLKKENYITDPKKFIDLLKKNKFDNDKTISYSRNFFQKLKLNKNIFKI